MARRIIRAIAARRDLLEIWSFIASENAPTVADMMLARLTSTFEILAASPGIGRVQSELRAKPRGFPVHPYKIIYESLPERDGILVWRILHGARDMRFIVRPPSADEI